MKVKSKRIWLLAGLCLMLMPVYAQQSVSKEINKIKLNTSYLYAEATMESEQEAADMAYELLMMQVDEYIGTKRKLNEASNVLIKDIKSRSEQLSMMRGSMYRVFVYVKKKDIEGVDNTTVVNSASGATITVSDNPIAQLTTPAQEEAMPEEIVTPVPAPELELQPEPKPVSVPKPLVEPAPEPKTEPVSVPEPEPVSVPAPDQPSWQRESIALLLQCQDLPAIRARLNRLKAEYRLKGYGGLDRCPNSEGAFWVIFDDAGHVVTVLGPGSNNRYDYRNKTLSSLDAYQGNNAIWFNFSK